MRVWIYKDRCDGIWCSKACVWADGVGRRETRSVQFKPDGSRPVPWLAMCRLCCDHCDKSLFGLLLKEASS